MSLEDLNRELYREDSKVIPNRTHESSEYDPASPAGQPSNPFIQEEVWQKEKKEIVRRKKKRILLVVGAVLLAIALISGGVFLYRWWQKNAFHQDRVEISFEGPKEADSTQQTKYIIRYKNNNRVTLKNAEMQLSYPENFQPIDNLNLKSLSKSSSKVFIGDVKPMSEGSIELKGIFYAPEDSPVFLRAAIHYIPSNGSEILNIENQISVKITAAPVSLSLVTPDQVASGDQMEYVIDYKNLDIRNMSNLQVRIDFPQGFQMHGSEPKPSEKESFWYVGNLESNQGGKITIKGSLFGDENENKDVSVSLGFQGDSGDFVVFNKRQASTRIVAPLLSVKQKLENKEDNIIKQGEVLKYSISFQNTGTVGLRNAIITAEIKGKILDFSKIDVGKGSYNGSTGIITWKASDVPELANIDPRGGGEVRFSVPVKNIVPIESKMDKNLVVTSIARIDSPDIPTPIDSNKIIGSNRLELKLSSRVILETNAFYNDQTIKNTGPIPMETGQETTFSVHWSITNVSNDISGARITSSLPSGIRWTGKIYPTTEEIAYDSRTNQIVWKIGDVPAATGIIDPKREVVFQIGVTPQINQIGEPVMLVNKSTLTAKDTFTDVDISLENEPKDTQLPEDPTVGYSNAKVAR